MRLVICLSVSAAFWLGNTLPSHCEEPGPYEKEIQPILANYCYGCHNPEKKKGDLDLSKFKTRKSVADAAETWENVSERVKGNEMPPKKGKPLADADRTKLVKWLDTLPKVELDCHKLATDENQNFYRGYVMSRRLSRSEYNNSIRDLFGIDFKLAEIFPADGSGGEGFNNNGDTLFISSIQMEKYLEGADRVVEALLPDKNTKSKQSDEAKVARQRLLFVEPSKSIPAREAARSIVASIARRAFRHPVPDAEVERLLKMFDRGQQRGDSFDSSLKLALKAVLVSPHFLFLAEPESDKEGVHPLDDYPLASRLAYFIWASAPDEQLMTLAENKRLHDPAVLHEQVQRMLKDPRSKGMAETFASQWLGLEGLNGAVKPDSKRFPEFDNSLAEAMRSEAILLFDRIMHEDRPLLELLDANYTFVNDRLAAHYGLPAVLGSEMRQVSLPDHSRGGILGLGAVLTATSYPLRTSPVLRGRWVVEEILGTKIPPPPPDVVQLPPDDHQPDNLSFRKRLEIHRTKAECASCHQRMDPLGFGLENFDPIGRWRMQQNGEPIDSTGQLPSGEKFNGPGDLKNILLKRKDEFLRNFTRKLLGFALGRGLTKFDTCVVNDSMKALAANNYRSSVVVEQIVLSYPFQYRYSKK